MSTSFKYLICFDFQVTCWKKNDPENAEIIGNFKSIIWCVFNWSTKWRLQQHYNDWKFFVFVFVFVLLFEEIGALLLNLNSGAIESEFHRYVKPAWNSNLSEYCINLTGISQQLINRQTTFTVVCQAFIDWLNQISKVKQLNYTSPDMQNTQYNNCNTTFCSWTNCNLKQYFRMDCERNTIEWPINLRAWINAQKIFQASFYLIRINSTNEFKVIVKSMLFFHFTEWISWNVYFWWSFKIN